MKTVMLKIPLAANSGYGHDGFSLSRALHEAGMDVRLSPTVVCPPLPMGVAQLLVKGLDVDMDYLIHHVDPQSIGLTDGQKRIPAQKIAWTMWEYDSLTEELDKTFASQLDGYDLLLAYDEVSATTFRPYAEKAGVPIKILQGGFWSKDWEFDLNQRDWSGPFRFGMAGQLGPRKNPFAAIHAFEEIHEEFPDTELVLKTNVMTLHPGMEQRWPGLKIHFETWPHERMKRFYSEIHTYLAPSWGEGKNLPALESQAMGIPAIYSDYGGHRQWGDSSTGWPIGGTIERHDGRMGSMRVDHDQLVAAMREAVMDREATRRKGEAASKQVISMCDWGVVVRRLRDILQ